MPTRIITLKYLIPTYNILVLLLHSKSTQNLALAAGFSAIYCYYFAGDYFFGQQCTRIVRHLTES